MIHLLTPRLFKNTFSEIFVLLLITEFTPPETSTKPFIIEYQPKVTNELPKIHKHHAKVTKSPQHKTSKHFVPLLNNDIMAEATSTSVSLYGKNDKNRKSQSIADDKDATRSMTPPNNGENKVKTWLCQLIIFYLVLRILCWKLNDPLISHLFFLTKYVYFESYNNYIKSIFQLMAVNVRKIMASFYFIFHLFLLRWLIFVSRGMRDFEWMYFEKLQNISFTYSSTSIVNDNTICSTIFLSLLGWRPHVSHKVPY